MDQFAEACGQAGFGAVPRLPFRRLAGDPAARRPRDRRMPYRLSAPPRRVRVQPAPKPMRGRRRRDSPARPDDREPSRCHARNCSPPRRDRLIRRRVRPRGARRHREPPGRRDRRRARGRRPRHRSAGCSPRAMHRSATASRSARRSSTRWSTIATSVPGVVAARMTGAGFGGCTVNLVRPDAVDRSRPPSRRATRAMTGLRPMVLPVNATDGAGRLSLNARRCAATHRQRPARP